MSRRGEERGGMPHEAVDRLLPWYVAGTLDARQTREVAGHLAACAACRREVGALEAVRSAVVRANEALPEPSPGSLERILARIDAEEAARAAGARPWWARVRARAATLEERAAALLERAGAVLLPPPLPAWRLAPVVAVLVIALQSAALVAVVARGGLGRVEYRTLSGPEGRAATGPTLIVVFDERAPERAIREALLEVGGTIVAGPTAEGAYTVAMGRPLASPADLDRIVEALRARRDLVRFVAKGG